MVLSISSAAWLPGARFISVPVLVARRCASAERCPSEQTDCSVKAGDELADKLIGVVVFVVEEERRN